MELTELIGWIGTLLIVLAYMLLSFDKLEEDDRRYMLLNLFGAIGVGFNVFTQHAWPAFALQIVWGVVALISLLKTFRARKELH